MLHSQVRIVTIFATLLAAVTLIAGLIPSACRADQITPQLVLIETSPNSNPEQPLGTKRTFKVRFIAPPGASTCLFAPLQMMAKVIPPGLTAPQEVKLDKTDQPTLISGVATARFATDFAGIVGPVTLSATLMASSSRTTVWSSATSNALSLTVDAPKVSLQAAPARGIYDQPMRLNAVIYDATQSAAMENQQVTYYAGAGTALQTIGTAKFSKGTATLGTTFRRAHDTQYALGQPSVINGKVVQFGTVDIIADKSPTATNLTWSCADRPVKDTSTVSFIISVSATTSSQSDAFDNGGFGVVTVDGVASSPILVPKGVGTYSVSNLTGGVHSVSASYVGGSYYSGSSSASSTISVAPTPKKVPAPTPGPGSTKVQRNT